jgi:phage/plasmid-like protein (TIGR03299 family)
MAHEVETMFSARQTPWHGLGTVTEDVLTARDAIVTAGLDWQVEPRALWTATADKKSKLRIEGKKAIVRSSDDSVLGLVSDRYQPFQNVEAFEFADSLVDSGEAKYETAGSLRHGKVIFLTMKLPQEVMVAGEDKHELYIVLRTSHDGTKAIQVAVTPIRVVCMNTMTMAMKSAKHKWAMQHTQKLSGKLIEARDTLKLSFKYVDEFVQLGTKMASTKITDDRFHDIISDLLPERPRTDEVLEQIMDLYRTSNTNGYYGTAWGGLNAFTEYFDHGRDTRSEEAVFNNIMDGSIAGWRNKLAKQLQSI